MPTINQTVKIKSTPEDIYESLLSPDVFAEITGAPAEIKCQEGASFSCFGGQITGRQVELEPGKKIIQVWRPSVWPDGVYSIVKFDFESADTHTLLHVSQTGFPEGMEEHLEAGWRKMYMEPLKAHFG